MAATIDIFQGSDLETSYYNVYFNIIIGGQIDLRQPTRVELTIPTAAPGSDAAAMRLVLKGTGFTYNAAGDVTAGTITTVEFYNKLGFIAQLTGYPIDGPELFAAFQAVRTSFDLEPIFDILYNRVPYVVNGSEFGDYFGAASLGDTFFGNGGDDSLDGAKGDDTIDGGAGNDRLIGGEGNDVLRGGADDDIFSYETGTDSIDGGPGTDYISFDNAPSGIELTLVDLGAATITWGGETKAIASIEGFVSRNDAVGLTILGNGANNVFVPQGFGQTVDGKGGHDRLIFYRHDDFFGGATRDSAVTIDVAAGTVSDSAAGVRVNFTNIESFAGSHSSDTMIGGATDDEFLPLQGADSVDGGGGNDTLSYELDLVVPDSSTTKKGAVVDLVANTATDTAGQSDTIANIENLTGSIADDVLQGTDGANVLRGMAGFDQLFGRGGNDTLDGGLNPDTQGDIMLGGLGDDTYIVDSGIDLVDEGIVYGGDAGGFDTIISKADFYWDYYSAGDLLQVAADATDIGGDGTTLVGSVFSNFLVGNAGTNILFGRGGADTYIAGDGVDFMSLSLLGTEGAYPGVDGVNTVIVQQRKSGPLSYDIIFEFEAGKDKVDVSDYAAVDGLSSGADVIALAVDDGLGNCYIALGDGLDYLYMVGLEKAQLLAGDFIV